jgi:hypothetical protein
MLSVGAELGGRGKDEPTRAPSRVLGHLAELRGVAKLVLLAELALAGRPGILIEIDTSRSPMRSQRISISICSTTR